MASTHQHSDEAPDIEEVITPGRRTMFSENQTLAQEMLPTLQEIDSILATANFGAVKATALFALIHGAIRQVAQGRSDMVRYEIGEKITEFQELISKMHSNYLGISAYPDVIRARNELKEISKHFDLLNRISFTLVDFSKD